MMKFLYNRINIVFLAALALSALALTIFCRTPLSKKSLDQARVVQKSHKKQFTGYKAVIYDLNGVLVKISKMGMAHEIGFKDTMFYYLFDCENKNDLQQKLFDTLAALGGYDQDPHAPCGELGNKMPKLMCDWMNGRMTNPQEELVHINQGIEQLKQEGFFKNNREYRVMKNMINALFHPSKLNKHRKPIKPMLKLVNQINQKGTCTQCVLSNWDGPSFQDFLTTKTGKALTCVIDKKNIVISADIACNKPHPDAFCHIMKSLDLDACECIFIDDQYENVQAARKLGMVGIQVKDKNYKAVKEELKRLKVL